MSGNNWPGRELTITFTHPALHDKRFMPLVFNAMREYETRGLTLYPAQHDAAGNHIDRFTSTDGAQVLVCAAPRGL